MRNEAGWTTAFQAKSPLWCAQKPRYLGFEQEATNCRVYKAAGRRTRRVEVEQHAGVYVRGLNPRSGHVGL